MERDIQAVKDGPTDPATLHAQLRALHAEAKRLRNEYKAVLEEAREHHRPLPAPFPSSLEP